MSRTLLLAAAALAIGSSAASAANSVMWDGVMQFVSQTAQCGTQFFNKSDTARSRYRPRLVSGDPRSAFTHYLGHDHSMLITNASPTAQFSGSGNYSNRGIDNFAQFSPTQTGAYTFTQSPATITASTDFVTLSGHIDNYANIAGCSLTFRGIYVRKP